MYQKILKAKVNKALDSASDLRVTKESIGYFRMAVAMVWTAPALYSAIFGFALFFMVGVVFPLVLRIFGTSLGGLSGIFKIFASFVQICGVAGGMLAIYAAINAFRKGSAD